MFTFENQFTKIEFEVEADALHIRRIAFFGKTFVCASGDGLRNTYLCRLGVPYMRKLFNRYGGIGEKLRFAESREDYGVGFKTLTVVEEGGGVSVKTVYTLYDNCATLACRKEVTATEDGVVLECVCPLTLKGIMSQSERDGVCSDTDVDRDITAGSADAKSSYCVSESDDLPVFIKAHNGWFSEACFEKVDLAAEGLRAHGRVRRSAKLSIVSNGSQTTHRYLPLGIFEKENFGSLMFELLPTGSWSYEIETGIGTAKPDDLILAVTDKTLGDNGWYKELKKGKTHKTGEVRLTGAADTDGILREITAFRRNVLIHNGKTLDGKVIYNNFMQNAYSNPTEENDKKFISLASEYSADYYVVDAGWHDDGIEANRTQQIGLWQEDKGSYPSGFAATADRVRKNGMKFGLWLELQSIGLYCKAKNILPEDCFFKIDGIRTVGNGRYQLNYADKRVRDYATDIVDGVVQRYSPDYIKIDYNHLQYGTDCAGGSYAEGLARHYEAYLAWFEEIQKKYPNIVFESCASGGMMADGGIARITKVFSISDQESYYNYAPIVANIPLSMLPEQSAVWCMPVRLSKYPATDDEEVIMNVINSLFGVMHLASRFDCITGNRKELLKEGIAYYRALSKFKKNAFPVLPKGYAGFDDEIVYAGLISGKKLYLNVWNIGDRTKKDTVDLMRYKAVDCRVAYPKNVKTEYCFFDGKLTSELLPLSARSFEIDLY